MKNLFKFISILLIIAGLNETLTSQPMYYNSNANGTNNSFPFNIVGGKRVQLLYNPGVFNLPTPAPSGTISSIAFRIGDTYPLGPWTYTNLTIQMGQTAITGFTAGAFYSGALTTVYFRSSVVLQAAGGTWLTINLDTPFAYNNTQGLVVDVEQCGVPGAVGFSMCQVATATNCRIYSGTTTGCPQVYGGIGTVNYAFGINLVTGPNIVTMPATSISAVSATLNGTCNANGLLSTVSFDYGLTTAYGNTVAGVPPTIGGNTVTPFSATIAGLTPLTLYHFRAKGTNANGTAYGADLTFTTLTATVTGIITNASNGLPIVGAKVNTIPAGTIVPSYSTGPTGFYSLIMPVTTTCQIMFHKEGFMDTLVASATYNPTQSYVINMAMKEDTPPPSSPFTAVLNSSQTTVNLNWGLPKDDMVLIYDDGIQDNFAIYATGSGNNMNAMKFTPVGYPAIVKKFYVNIGTAANYPSGSNAFSPVQFAIYNETPAGLPGTPYPGTTTTITPTVYGWTEASFNSTVTIASGNFFIVMIQLGTSSASPGIAIDTTTQQLRSYSKFGNNPWIPGPGNYMIRAVVNGSGGPLLLAGQSGVPITASAVPGLIYQYAPATVTGFEGSPKGYSDMGYNPDNLLGYQVWRLLQGQEATPGSWVSIGTPAGTSIQDNSWPSLPCDPYRWGIEAQYTFNRWSTAIFSNAIGKCWICNVTVNVALSCDSANAVGALVKLQNNTVPDTVYTYVMTATGTHTFTNFWKGSYTLTINKFGYSLYTQTPISIMGDMTINATILEIKAPPTGLHIPDSTLLATWHPPSLTTLLLNETFGSGSFTTNGWVVDAGGNWSVNAYDGNPTYCAEFYYYPVLSNYSYSLTSKSFTGVGSPSLQLKYDIYLNNYSGTGAEHMAVELWNGSTWLPLKDYANTGSIAWKTEIVDISAYTNSNFKVRFRAYGAYSYDINYWDIDNVQIVAGAQTTGPNPCIFGYNFYLNNILIGFTPDTFYNIPPAVVVYGTAYNACVLAVYGSGYSTQSCVTLTSKFLCPPGSLTATPIECSVDLTWKKPDCGNCTLKSYIEDSGVAGDGYTTTVGQMGNYYPIAAYTAGVIKSVDMYFSSISGTTTAQSCIVYFYKPDHTLFGQSAAFINNGAAWSSGTWDNAACADIPYTGPFYAMVDYTSTSYKNFFDVDITTSTTAYPVGFGYVQQNGTWGLVAPTFGYDAKATFLERINVCDNSKDKDAPITTIDPLQMPAQDGLPHLAANIHAGAITDGSNVAGDPPVTSLLAPAASPVLLGYRIFRNNVMIDTIMNPNHFEFYDYNLNPGTYAYKVDALYNVSPFTPSPWHSQPAGPVSVSVSCGYPLPFNEEWNSATFIYQDWTFSPSQGNWSINTAFGDPTPCADFSWDPVVTNYSLSLVSPTIDATAWTCADIFCDFEYKLVDRNATGNEKLDIDILKNGNWVNKLELANNGSVGWTLKHIDITTVKGKAFMVRFRANGVNSSDILHWYVDNIHIYGECHPPQTLTGHQNQFTTTLTWLAPTCGGGGPTPQWITWCDGTNYTSIGAGVVDMWIANRWDAAQIVPLDGGSITKINFWPASAGTATYRARIWEGPLPTVAVVDQAVPTIVTDQWNTVTLTTPHPIDISKELWIGMEVNSTGGYPAGCDPGPAVDGYGDMTFYNGAWATLLSLNPSLDFNWDIEAYVEPSKKEAGASSPIIVPIPNNSQGQTLSISGKRNTASNTSSNHGSGRILPESPMGSQLLGYNIWRTPDNQTTGFVKVNPSIWSTLTYTDVHPSTTALATTWHYYVTAEFQDSLHPAPPMLCEPSSDTIMITFPAVGINDLTNSSLSLYPNPANDVVNVVSTNDIKTIEVLNYIGQAIYTNKDINLKSLQLNVSSFQSGVYFVKVTTVSGIKTTKITVTH